MNLVQTQEGFFEEASANSLQAFGFRQRKTCTLNPLHPKGLASFAVFADFFSLCAASKSSGPRNEQHRTG
jgi:hypothetical protein